MREREGDLHSAVNLYIKAGLPAKAAKLVTQHPVRPHTDMKCMQTNFDGRGLSGFGDMTPFCLPSKTAKISLQTMDYSPWGPKNGIGSKNSCK